MLPWSMKTLRKRITPKRLHMLRMMRDFDGTHAVSLAYGYREFWKQYVVWSLTELHDVTHMTRALRPMGLFKRRYPGSVDWVLSSRGLLVLEMIDAE